jgi:hypothetical protein
MAIATCPFRTAARAASLRVAEAAMVDVFICLSPGLGRSAECVVRRFRLNRILFSPKLQGVASAERPELRLNAEALSQLAAFLVAS